MVLEKTPKRTNSNVWNNKRALTKAVPSHRQKAAEARVVSVTETELGGRKEFLSHQIQPVILP